VPEKLQKDQFVSMVSGNQSPLYRSQSVVRTRSIGHVEQHEIDYASKSALYKQMILDCVLNDKVSRQLRTRHGT
jgi:hypothetical protein